VGGGGLRRRDDNKRRKKQQQQQRGSEQCGYSRHNLRISPLTTQWLGCAKSSMQGGTVIRGAKQPPYHPTSPPSIHVTSAQRLSLALKDK